MDTSKMWNLEGPDSNAHIYSQTNSVSMPVNTKVALLHRLPMPYNELVNHANTVNLIITISTVWAFYVDFYVFS